jgi:beta-lactamase class A
MFQRGLIISNTVLLVILGVLLFDSPLRNFEEAKAQRDYSSEYKFTNPILDYENAKMESSSLVYSHVKSKVEELKDKYKIDFDSIYFRDLDNGQWIGFNEKAEFASASLIKLPILIAFLRQAEVEPGLLDRMVTVTEEDMEGLSIQDIPPEIKLSLGETLTLKEVAERMIQQSDNVAMKVLAKNIDEKYRNSIFSAVGVVYNMENNDVMVRVKDYASFFRVLFNASYLSREHSELALDMLSKTTFTRGLVAGLPKTIQTSHKFGERTYYMDDVVSSRQLHDCGIIYYPQKPYILCVMTRGDDYDNQALFIREVSKLFYTELEKSF